MLGQQPLQLPRGPGRAWALLLLLLLPFLPCCATPPFEPSPPRTGQSETTKNIAVEPPPVPDVDKAEKLEQAVPPYSTEVVGHSVEGRPIKMHVFEPASYRETVLLMATIHGNEAAGTPLLHEIRKRLEADGSLHAQKKVILLPVVNPDGLASNRRYNSRGVDLNRNFPATNWAQNQRHGRKALSEPESRVIHQLIESYHPSRIISIHQPVACIDYDGPGELLARYMGNYCELPVRRLGGRPGSLGSYAGLSRGIPIITLELPGNASRLNKSDLWESYGEMLLAAIRFDSPQP